MWPSHAHFSCAIDELSGKPFINALWYTYPRWYTKTKHQQHRNILSFDFNPGDVTGPQGRVVLLTKLPFVDSLEGP